MGRGERACGGKQGKAKQSNIGKHSSSAFICCGGLMCVEAAICWREGKCHDCYNEWVGDTLLPCMSINLANMYSFRTKINACLT